MTPNDDLNPPRPPFAAILFWLAFAYLLTVAGVIHRAHQADISNFEEWVLAVSLMVLWPLFLAEAIYTARRRHESQPRGRVIRRAILVSLFPPLRMGLRHPMNGLVWLPRLGWRVPGKDLLAKLDHIFRVPMLVFAFLILPVLGFEYVASERANANSWFLLALHISIAAIWVAFAVEFILKFSVAPQPVLYVKEKWVDLAIVVLPALEFVLTYWANSALLARLLRLTRASDQLSKYGRLYRMRGLMMKGWHAILTMRAMSRLLGRTLEIELKQNDEAIATLEEELAHLREHSEQLRAQIAEKAAQKVAS